MNGNLLSLYRLAEIPHPLMQELDEAGFGKEVAAFASFRSVPVVMFLILGLNNDNDMARIALTASSGRQQIHSPVLKSGCYTGRLYERTGGHLSSHTFLRHSLPLLQFCYWRL
jgi:hypothetical protein